MFQDHENNGEPAAAPTSQPASTKHQPHIEKGETVSKATGANTAQGVSKWPQSLNTYNNMEDGSCNSNSQTYFNVKN